MLFVNSLFTAMDGINVLFDVLTSLVGLLAEGTYQIDVEALVGMGKHTGPILCLFATSFFRHSKTW